MILDRILTWFHLEQPAPSLPSEEAIEAAFRRVNLASQAHAKAASAAITSSLNALELAAHDKRPAELKLATDRLSRMASGMLSKLQ